MEAMKNSIINSDGSLFPCRQANSSISSIARELGLYVHDNIPNLITNDSNVIKSNSYLLILIHILMLKIVILVSFITNVSHVLLNVKHISLIMSVNTPGNCYQIWTLIHCLQFLTQVQIFVKAL